MADLNNTLYLVVAVPIIFFVIFILYLVLKKPQILSKATKKAARDNPTRWPTTQAFLALFNSLEELKAQKKRKLIYLVGLIGVTGTIIVAIAVLILIVISVSSVVSK